MAEQITLLVWLRTGEIRVHDLEDMYHYRNRALCRVPEALGKALKTLGKGFAECRTRQRRLGKQCIGKAFFVEYFFSGTRQRGLPLWRRGDGDGVFAECHG